MAENVNVKRIVERGAEVKYKIEIQREGFVMDTDNFELKLSWGLMDQHLIIKKSQMLTNEAGEWFFTFTVSDEMVGRLMVECSYDVPDDDYHDGFRTEVNRQCLALVIDHPLPPRICIPGAPVSGNNVIYTQIYQSDVAELYDYLTDRRGNKLVTSDGYYLLALNEI